MVEDLSDLIAAVLLSVNLLSYYWRYHSDR